MSFQVNDADGVSLESPQAITLQSPLINLQGTVVVQGALIVQGPQPVTWQDLDGNTLCTLRLVQTGDGRGWQFVGTVKSGPNDVAFIMSTDGSSCKTVMELQSQDAAANLLTCNGPADNELCKIDHTGAMST